MDLFTRKGGLSLHYNTMGEGYPVVLVHTNMKMLLYFKI